MSDCPHITTLGRRVADVYDEVASRYDDWVWQKFWRRNELPLVVNILRQQNTGRSLDVGIGTGAYVATHLETSDFAVGIDISNGMLAVLRHHWPGFPVANASATRLPFADALFDTILATRVLTHIDNVSEFFGEASRVLRQGGQIIISDLDNEHDYEAIRFSELKDSNPTLRLRPVKHSFSALTRAAAGHNLYATDLTRVQRGGLLWDPGPESPASLGDDPHAPVFYVAVFRRE